MVAYKKNGDMMQYAYFFSIKKAYYFLCQVLHATPAANHVTAESNKLHLPMIEFVSNVNLTNKQQIFKSRLITTMGKLNNCIRFSFIVIHSRIYHVLNFLRCLQDINSDMIQVQSFHNAPTMVLFDQNLIIVITNPQILQKPWEPYLIPIGL